MEFIKHLIFPMICGAIAVVAVALLIGIWDSARKAVAENQVLKVQLEEAHKKINAYEEYIKDTDELFSLIY